MGTSQSHVDTTTCGDASTENDGLIIDLDDLLWVTTATETPSVDRPANQDNAVTAEKDLPVSEDGFVEESDLCAVCLEEPCRVMLDPCGHKQFCVKCASLVTTCPLCRTAIRSWQDSRFQYVLVAAEWI